VRALIGPEQELLGTAESISTDGALQIRPTFPAPTDPPLIGIRAADVIHLKE
jgi:BirA family biotin operon repressor/biotin-[acetyl-CoA-carboxylase] ligase